MSPSLSPEGSCHETPAEVRYGETDQMGYAHHSVAISWFELGRVVWMRDHGYPYRRLEESGILMPVVRLTLHYHTPGRFEDPLVIQTRLAELGRSRVTFENRVLKEAKTGAEERILLVDGRVELACVDRSGHVQRIPEEIRKCFTEHLNSPPFHPA